MSTPAAGGAFVAAPESNEDLLRSRGFEIMKTWKPQGLIRRMLVTWRHFLGLLFGGLAAQLQEQADDGGPRTWRYVALWFAALPGRLFVDRTLRHEPFPVQLRRRLERLGPTYIKLGQILSLREDLLPKPITDELKHLLNRLPVVPLPILQKIIERDLKRPLAQMFLSIDPIPLGSASIGQTHMAVTVDGQQVILKVVKPGIRQTLLRDAKLLRMLGSVAQLIIPRFQPRQLVNEFCTYTLREVDLRLEAENAEIFAGHFEDIPDVVFPRIYRKFSGRSVLCMEFFDGLSPDKPEALELPEEQRRHLTDLGAMAIIRMLYKDGFFHADLHPANLIILPGPKLGFIDLGMVGRLDEDLRRALMYYYFALVMGDGENAARYLTAIARPGPNANPNAFRRDAVDIANRWKRGSNFSEFSLGQLILQSLSRGAEHGMYFPVELVLMVKALVTFEGVGNLLLPGFDVAEVSKKHIRSLFIDQFSPMRIFTEGMRGMPDMVDAMAKMPLLVTDGLRVLEKFAHQPTESPLSGLRGTLIAGSCLVAGAVAMGFRAPWPVWSGFFTLAFILAVRRG
ncbi:MAG: AarF/ABC1/UbiB kinase family protein [Holophagaceae bacterium]|nr:AarF/ABC1/UbiB kinase family protein [Holophagaceae bacterium]